MENIILPEYLTENTYFYSSGYTARTRKSNEEKRIKAISEFFIDLGFNVETTTNTVVAKLQDIEVFYSYSESSKNVYKKFTVHIGGKKSNKTGLMKFIRNI